MGQGADPGDAIEEHASSYQPFSKNIFLMYYKITNFSIISNLFESDKPDAVSTHNRKMCEQKCRLSYLAKRSELGVKKFKQNLSENYSKKH